MFPGAAISVECLLIMIGVVGHGDSKQWDGIEDLTVIELTS